LEFRPDGTFVHLPLHDLATLTETFRRGLPKMFVKRKLVDIDTAQSMLAWTHSGFHVHGGVWAACALLKHGFVSDENAALCGSSSIS
jgi:hypothetical protein